MIILQTKLEKYLYQLIKEVFNETLAEVFYKDKDSFFWLHSPQFVEADKKEAAKIKKQNKFLALASFAASVDYYDENWKDATKRQIAADAFRTHKIKGSIKSFEEAFDVLGYNIKIITNLSDKGAAGQDLPPPFHLIFELNTQKQEKKELDKIIFRNLNLILKSLMPAKCTYEVVFSFAYFLEIFAAAFYIPAHYLHLNASLKIPQIPQNAIVA